MVSCLLNPLLEASDEIGKQNLDFQVKKSNIQEFNAILDSLEKMQKKQDLEMLSN